MLVDEQRRLRSTHKRIMLEKVFDGRPEHRLAEKHQRNPESRTPSPCILRIEDEEKNTTALTLT